MSEFTIEHNGTQIRLSVSRIQDRVERYDYLNSLGLLSLSPDDARQPVPEFDGETVGLMQTLVTESASHPDLNEQEIQTVVTSLNVAMLFKATATILTPPGREVPPDDYETVADVKRWYVTESGGLYAEDELETRLEAALENT